MGIKGLLSHVKEYLERKNIQYQYNLEKYKGKKIAVDVYIWFYLKFTFILIDFTNHYQ